MSLVLAIIIAWLDWLLPALQLAYLELLPVLLVGAVIGPRTGIVAAAIVSPPVTYLEYIGAFRERDSNLPVNVVVMAAILMFATVLFHIFLQREAERTSLRDARELAKQNEALARSEERYRLLGESLPGTTWTALPDGKLDHVSGGTSLPDDPTLSLHGDGWLSIVHPDDRAAAVARWQASVDSGRPYETQFRVATPEGEYRWNLVRALPQRNAAGTIVRWVGVNVDIHDQRTADEQRERFVLLAENSTDFIGMTDVEGNVVYGNRTALDMLSLDDPKSIHFLECFTPHDQEYVKSVILPVLEREGRWAGDFKMRNFATGATFPIFYNAFVLNDRNGKKIGLATISRDIAERERIDIGLQALVDSGSAMYGSLAYEETLQNVAEAVAKTFATSCTIDVIDDDGSYRRVAIVHAQRPEMRAIFEDYNDQNRFTPGHPVVRAIQRGESTCVTNVEEWSKGQLPSLVDVLQRLAIRSFITVPVRSAGGAVFGALTCCVDDSATRPSYVVEDVPFAEELGRRAGIAVQHAREYERERNIAVRFQEASLPTTLPAVANAVLSADYRPGRSEATVGGDWYDAFQLEDGRIAITIGDVLGKGLDAAVTMAKVRQAMRAAASLFPHANAMLGVAESTIRDVSVDTYATALAGIYDARAATFTFACAGHPGPIVRHADGRIDECNAAGAMLGLGAEHIAESTIAVTPGSTLIFFTDGLTEATRDVDEGYRRLYAALADPAVMMAENLAAAIVERALHGIDARDDIAVLAARIRS